MEDDKSMLQSMLWHLLATMVMVVMIGSSNTGAICPTVCHCYEEALTASCANAALEFVPIQLNPEVKTIDLSNNKISNFHFTLSFYDKLVNLDLSSNKISNLGIANFEYQKVLKHLNLSNNEIEKLNKDSLKGLKALTVLDLSFNRLEKLTSIAFRELHSLTVLKLCGNRLVHLEQGLFKPTKHLQDLHLEDNQFMVIPTAALIDVPTLRHLSLSRNLLASLKEGEIPQFSQLTSLHLDGNIISNITHDAFIGFISLDHLDVSDNNFTEIPTKSISRLSNLTTLRFSGNFIDSIRALAFRGLFHLKIIKLDRLPNLKIIDSRAFVDNINLEKIWMDFNIELDKLPTRIFHGNPKLRYVSVRYNKLETLEVTHFPLDQLRELKLGGNPFQCNCSLGWLWQLIKQQKSKTVQQINFTEIIDPEIESTVSPDLLLDIDDIRCDGPEDMKDMLLSEVNKYQIDCSVGWMAAVSVVTTILFILAVIGGVVYWAPTRKSHQNKKDLSTMDTRIHRTATCSNGMAEPYEVARIEKCMMPPPILHNDYRSLPSWDPYGAHCQSTMNIYETLDDNVKSRPHIVYV